MASGSSTRRLMNHRVSKSDSLQTRLPPLSRNNEAIDEGFTKPPRKNSSIRYTGPYSTNLPSIPTTNTPVRRLTRPIEVEKQYEEEEDEPVVHITKALPFLQPKERITAVLHTNRVVINEPPTHRTKYIKGRLAYLIFGFVLAVALITFFVYFIFNYSKLLHYLSAFCSICWQFLSRPDISAVIQSIGGIIAIIGTVITIFKFFAGLGRK